MPRRISFLGLCVNGLGESSTCIKQLELISNKIAMRYEVDVVKGSIRKILTEIIQAIIDLG